MFNPLHSSMTQELFKKHLCNQNSRYENTDDFHYEGKPSRVTAKLTLLLSAKMNGTQRRTHEECIVRTTVYQKGTSRTEVTSNSEKIKPVALAVIKLCLSEASVSQLLSQ